MIKQNLRMGSINSQSNPRPSTHIDVSSILSTEHWSTSATMSLDAPWRRIPIIIAVESHGSSAVSSHRCLALQRSSIELWSHGQPPNTGISAQRRYIELNPANSVTLGLINYLLQDAAVRLDWQMLHVRFEIKIENRPS